MGVLRFISPFPHYKQTYSITEAHMTEVQSCTIKCNSSGAYLVQHVCHSVERDRLAAKSDRVDNTFF